MSLYKHLDLAHAKIIIILANKGYNKSQINKETSISLGKITRCLNSCRIVTVKPNIRYPFKEPRKIITYSFKLYKDIRDQKKLHKAYNQATEAVVIYQPFIDFCSNLYSKKILNKKVKRSANEYIKEFKRTHPSGVVPSKS